MISQKFLLDQLIQFKAQEELLAEQLQEVTEQLWMTRGAVNLLDHLLNQESSEPEAEEAPDGE